MATHFTEIYDLQLVKTSEQVKFFTMNFIVKEKMLVETDNVFQAPTNAFSVLMSSRANRASRATTTHSSMISSEEFQSKEQLVFLYKLVEGCTISSYGSFCAMISGVPRSIVERATQITRSFRQGEEISPIEESDARETLQKHKQITKLFLEFDEEKGDVNSFLKKIFSI